MIIEKEDNSRFSYSQFTAKQLKAYNKAYCIDKISCIILSEKSVSSSVMLDHNRFIAINKKLQISNIYCHYNKTTP